MSFFDKGKGKDKDKTPADAGGKESFSLFKKKAAADSDESGSGRFLTLVRGQAAQPAEVPANSPPAASSSKPRSDAPVSAPEPVAQPAVEKVAPQSSMFSLSRKHQAPQVSESATPAPASASAPAAAPAPAPAPDVKAKTAATANDDKQKKSSFNVGSLGLGKLFSKTTAEQASPKSASPAKERPRASGKAALGSSKDFHVYVELDNGKKFFWSISANHIQEVDPKKVVRAASFSRDDVSLRSDSNLSHKKAEDLALQEIGEPVHIVNRTKDLGVVYATQEERALTSEFRIFPGQQAIDRLVKDAKVAGKSVITGFVFNGQDGRTTLCVLFYINVDGLMTKPQITLNPDNMDFVISQFATSRKINKKEAEILLFNNADFLGQVNGLQAYPDERVWQGIPVSLLVRSSAIATVVGAVALTGWAGQQYYQVGQLQQAIAKVESKAADDGKKTSTLVAASLYPFAAAMSLDEEHSLQLAQQVWQPGSRVIMTANQADSRYEIRVPVTTNRQFNNRPSVDSTPLPQEVQKAINFEPPQGCSKENTSVSGNLNEIQITVVCENSNSALSGFRND